MKLRKVKALLLGCMFLVMTGLLVAQNFDLEGHLYRSVSPSPFSIKFLDNNKILFEWNNGNDNYEKEYTYKKTRIGRLPLFILDSKMPKDLYSLFTNYEFEPTDRFILLTGLTKNKVTALGILPYKTGNDGFFFETSLLNPTGEHISLTFKNASSFLTEKKTEYQVQNLNDMCPDKPWVEGVTGWGIGENFTIDTSNGRYKKHLIIMNGYISAKNPNLYHENGRIKKIKVTGLSTGEEKVFTIKDTPHPQSIDISFLPSAQNLKITILDVYKGTKYQDTCLHFITTWNNEVIPYED